MKNEYAIELNKRFILSSKKRLENEDVINLFFDKLKKRNKRWGTTRRIFLSGILISS